MILALRLLGIMPAVPGWVPLRHALLSANITAGVVAATMITAVFRQDNPDGPWVSCAAGQKTMDHQVPSRLSVKMVEVECASPWLTLAGMLMLVPSENRNVVFPSSKHSDDD